MRLHKKQAFTLIEVMIVVLILGALTAIAIPRINGGAYTAGVNACRKNVDIINNQIELYYSKNGSWPIDLGDVTKDPNYFPDGPPECPLNKPYIYIKTNGRNRVLEHVHLNKSEVKEITEFILEKD